MKRLSLLLFLSLVLAVHGLAQPDTNVLTLAEAQDIALKNHPRIAAASYRSLAAAEAVEEARAGYFPNAKLFADAVDASSDGTRILAGGLNNPSIYDRAAGGVQVSQLITDFGHTANLAASSRLQAQAEQQNASATREEVLLQVRAGYFGALQARAVLRVAQQTLDTRQLLLDKVSVLSSNKLRSDLDVSFARVALDEGRLLVQKAQNNADAAMTSLSTALGYRGPQVFELVDQAESIGKMTNDISQLVETALQERPELLSLRNERDAARRYAESQFDSRLPTVEVIGEAGGAAVHDSHLPDSYAAGGVQLSLPLFAGGLYTARQHEAELKAEADSQMLRAAEDNVVRDVHLAWLNVNNAQEQLATTGQLVRNAEEAYALAEARYKIGSSSIVELSQAQLSLTTAQIAGTSARYAVLIEQANLAYQTGTLR